MSALLNGLEPVIGWLLRVSAQAAVLILLILLVQAACGSRLAARWRYALWLLVLARLPSVSGIPGRRIPAPWERPPPPRPPPRPVLLAHFM